MGTKPMRGVHLQALTTFQRPQLLTTHEISTDELLEHGNSHFITRGYIEILIVKLQDGSP